MCGHNTSIKIIVSSSFEFVWLERLNSDSYALGQFPIEKSCYIV